MREYSPLTPPSKIAKRVFAKLLENNNHADMRAVPNEWVLKERGRTQNLAIEISDLETENAQLRAELAALRHAHWTYPQIIKERGHWVAYDEAGLEHSRHDTYDEARDSLVVYAATLLNAPKPASPEGWEQEPVAWIVEHDDYPTEVELISELDHAQKARKKEEAMGWRFTPLYKAPQPAIPEGFALVPVEPTPGMIEAGREPLILGDFKKVKNNYERIYKAMLAAKENNNGN